MAVTSGTVHVEGLRELVRDFGRMSKELKRDLQAELRQVAGPVAEEARGLASRFGERTASGIRPRTRTGVVVVQQTRRRTTGKRPDFGSLIMRRVLIPALDNKRDEVIDGLEGMLDRLADRNGF